MVSGSQLLWPLFWNLPSHLWPAKATAASAARSIRSLDPRASGNDDYTDTNASRFIHQKMEKMGYSLPVPIHTMDHVCETADVTRLTSYHIKPEDWVKHWMNERPELLGGWNGCAHKNFKSFWHAYQLQHPGHKVFSEHQGRLDRVVPLILHGDEGRAVKRTNYLVLSIESPLGSLDDPTIKCTCHEELGKRSGLPSYGPDLKAVDPEILETCSKQTTNFKGHSYLSHFLLFGLGGWIYKRNPNVVDDLIKEVSKSFQKLFDEGVSTSDGIMYAAIVAIKGDMDFHKKVMQLERSYSNLGTSRSIELCHLCKAGGPNVPFEDYSEFPTWLQTFCVERPWSLDEPPELSRVPFDDTCPELILQPDLFHIHKLGVARDIIGGILVLLLRLKFFDFPGSTVNIVDRFQRAHSYFALWCSVQGKSPGLRSFTKAFFNMKTLVSAPWASSKGSDSILLLQWLSYTLKLNIQNPTVPGHEVLLKQMNQVCDAALSLRMLHHHRLWLGRKCAMLCYVRIMTVLRGYSVLGRAAINLRIRAFIQKPKHHALHHVAIHLQRELRKGATLILSPQCNACEINEDFMGRNSRLSRRVGFRLCDLRVIHRYFMKVSCLIKRRDAKKTKKVWAKR